MAEPVFHIVPENIEVEHVAQKMEPPAMQKHRGKQGQDSLRKVQMSDRQRGKELCRHDAPGIQKLLQMRPEGNLIEKAQQIDQYDGVIDKRNSA